LEVGLYLATALQCLYWPEGRWFGVRNSSSGSGWPLCMGLRFCGDLKFAVGRPERTNG